MRRVPVLTAAALFSIFHFQFSVSVTAQTVPHDISQVDIAPTNGAMSVPLPESQQRRLKKYEIPELVGSRQALGSRLIDGRLPRPLLDFKAFNGPVRQRLSIFEGGLVVVSMTGAGGVIKKKLLIPMDALAAYLKAASAKELVKFRENELPVATGSAGATLRIYTEQAFVERQFDPTAVLPKTLQDEVLPLQDLLRAISEDRTVTNTVAGYDPKVGDKLVGDDKKTWRVDRVIAESGIVVLHCTTDPTTIYVSKKDLYNYFIGAAQESAAQP